MQTGRTYLNNLNSDRSIHGMHDLNLPPPSSSGFAMPDDSSLLDLKLARGHGDGSGRYCGSFQSVCTLEKVKSALERAGRARVSEPQGRQSEVVSSASASASPSSSTTSSSMKRRLMGEEDDGGSAPTGGMMVAACPTCLLYVLISKANPRCPRCESHGARLRGTLPRAYAMGALQSATHGCMHFRARVDTSAVVSRASERHHTSAVGTLSCDTARPAIGSAVAHTTMHALGDCQTTMVVALTSSVVRQAVRGASRDARPSTHVSDGRGWFWQLNDFSTMSTPIMGEVMKLPPL
ncbi:hypothetical protein KSP39_PZI002940 [Platanthera zijinensis]|uniref:GIR1-like zinc ribbon domain-containing protein n=1 Tax=Platanthera zijinensis TaxID=2320716 RepID=A0AAP0BYZ5_9ASPA